MVRKGYVESYANAFRDRRWRNSWIKQSHASVPLSETAVSGKNGTGKSTILACVACAFHNHPSGFRPLNRRIAYYTFSDFFIQSAEEEPLAFVWLRYQILYDNWRKTKNLRSGVGLGWQARKKFFGRWNNYAS